MRRALMVLAGAILTAPLAAWVAPEPAPPPPPPPEATFESEIDVSLLTMVVRVVDTWGKPILGLRPQDFRVHVGAREVPVAALDWIAEDVAAAPADAVVAPADLAAGADLAAAAEAAFAAGLGDAPDRAIAPSPATSGRLVVVFVQADLTPVRISGQMRLRPHTRELLGTLRSDDRVAVVSFDSHLKLRQDFAADREATIRAIDEAMVFSPERRIKPARPHSLAAHFDAAAARGAASPEQALELVGRALEPLPGEKTVLFLGWGIGRFGSTGVTMTPDFAPAVQALRAARASVFVLDVTSADYHSLETGLQMVAGATGGAYYSTYRLPALATRTLSQAISGYYVLTLDHAALGDQQGKVKVELRDKSGTVLARPLGLYAPPS
jgi:VWFA-related protein